MKTKTENGHIMNLELMKKLRKNKRLSFRKLGALAGIDQSSLQRFETGQLEAKFWLIDKLCKILGVNIWCLMENPFAGIKGEIHKKGSLIFTDKKPDMKCNHAIKIKKMNLWITISADDPEIKFFAGQDIAGYTPDIEF